MELKIDHVQTGLPFSEKDFVCSDNVRTAPLGGWNEYSLDVTAVDNMPPCVCSECGGKNRMQPFWAYPIRQPELARQGIHPVPKECFENNFRGGYPVRPRSGTAVLRDDGMYRDPGAAEVKLFQTTCGNWKRLQQNEANAVAAQRYGKRVRHVNINEGIVGESNNARGWEGEVEDTGYTEIVKRTKEGVSRSKKPVPIDITP